MSISARLFSTYQHGKSLIKIGKKQIQFYTTNILTHHSFLFDPPRKGQDGSDSLIQAPKEVIPLLQAIYQNNAKETWKLYKELCHRKQLYLLSPLQYSKVLRTFSFERSYDKKQRHTLAMQLSFIFNKMKRNGIKPDVIDYTHMMNVFSLIGNFKFCDKLWEEMTERKIQPNTHTYNSYLTSCLRLIKSNKQKEGLQKAQKILISLNNNGRKPNLVTNCLLIQLFLASNELKNAQYYYEITFSQNNLWGKLIREEIIRNQSIITCTFIYLMNAYGITGDLSMMDECFKTFLSTKLPPHINMFSALVRNSSRKDIDKAKGYIKKMIQEFDLKPTHRIFNFILLDLCDKGSTKKATEFLKVMQDEYEFPPSEFMLVKVYKLMLKKKRYEDAKEFATLWKIPRNEDLSFFSK